MINANIKLKGKSIAIWDAETDGLLHEVTLTHCIVITDARTKEVYRFTDIQKALDKLDEYEVHAGHNLIGFDYPLLKQMYGWAPSASTIIVDTMWLSRMFNADIEGGHSLGAWGARLGNKKEEYYPVLDSDQPVYDPEEKLPKKNPCWKGSIWSIRMEDYCAQDTLVNVDLFWLLIKETASFNWMSIACEMDTARLMQRQMEHGFVFDYNAAEVLYAKLLDRQMEIETQVKETFKPKAKLIKEVQPKVRMNGTLSPIGLKKQFDITGEAAFLVPEFTRHESLNEDTGKVTKSVTYQSGSLSTIEWPEFSLGSRTQIAERLTLAGYKLKEFTELGTPIINDATLKIAAESGIKEAEPLAEYFLITKRVGMVKDWLSKARWHPSQNVWRIHGRVNSLGAVSSRMTHNSPNVAQVPSSHSPYGEECRSLFTVRSGYTLVGCDASGLELRMLAHYMNDKVYTDTVLNGDIHTANQLAAELPTRDMAKTMIYGFLYGAGDKKLGEIVGGKSKEGKLLKEKFLKNTPALRRLRHGVIEAATDRKWLKALDGRILRIRSPHSSLNTLLQGGGAIVMKVWLLEVQRVADLENLDWNPSANVHDEAQCEVLNAHVDRFKEICENAFNHVTQVLKLNCAVAGEAMSGSTWSDTH